MTTSIIISESDLALRNLVDAAGKLNLAAGEIAEAVLLGESIQPALAPVLAAVHLLLNHQHQHVLHDRFMVAMSLTSAVDALVQGDEEMPDLDPVMEGICQALDDSTLLGERDKDAALLTAAAEWVSSDDAEAEASTRLPLAQDPHSFAQRVLKVGREQVRRSLRVMGEYVSIADAHDAYLGTYPEDAQLLPAFKALLVEATSAGELRLREGIWGMDASARQRSATKYDGIERHLILIA